MSDTERRAMDLAKNIVAAVKAVDTPNRNARAMLTDASMWSNIAFHIVNVIEGNDSIKPEAEAPAEEENGDNAGDNAAGLDDGDDDEKPRKKRSRRT